MENSQQELFIYMVVERFIYKNNLITRFPSPSHPKQVWDILKQELIFTVNITGISDLQSR